MAERRGGYRVPEDRAPKASGVGSRSKRTDNQRIQVPRVGDAEDLSYGDGQRLTQAMRGRPLRRAPRPDVAEVAPPQTGRVPPHTPGGGALSAALFSRPSSRPSEPGTEGAPWGPGAGPEALSQVPEPDDDREFVLDILSRPPFNNRAAQDLARELRDERAQRSRQMMPVGPEMTTGGPSPEEAGAPASRTVDLPLPMGDEGPEEPLPEDEVVADAGEVAPEVEGEPAPEEPPL